MVNPLVDEAIARKADEGMGWEYALSTLFVFKVLTRIRSNMGLVPVR